MFQRLNHRWGHYLLLIAVSVGLFLPNLGAPTLWDIDEGNNAEAAREMLVGNNWKVPTFNYQIRVDKPALLYWFQIFAYQVFGVGEFAARLPSALAAMATVLVTYELGRRMFGALPGLLAGLVLASAVLFCAAAHFANPDALLAACTILTLFLFWQGYEGAGRVRFVWLGIASGCAVLAKGPVGLVLPAAVIGLFLLWSGQLRLLWDRRVLLGLLAFAVVALPWYILVHLDTKAFFVREFIQKHNVNRFLNPLEGHGGPPYYYLVVLSLGFAPWSAFFLPAFWYSFKGDTAENNDTETRRHGDAEIEAAFAASPRRRVAVSPRLRFLCCWLLVYLVFFSVSRTKLPNYILPIYPAVALLIGRFLDDWRRGRIEPPAWMMNLSLACLALMGIGTAVGLAVVGGVVQLPNMPAHRQLPGLETGAVLGVALVLGAGVARWFVWRSRRTGLIVSVTAAIIFFVGSLAVWGGAHLNTYKAPQPLAEMIEHHQTDREIRIAAFAYTQPSLVFYCRREVSFLGNEGQALDFLRSPLEVYLVMPAPNWEGLANKIRGPYRLVGRRRDLYRGCDIVVVTNR